MKFYPPRVSKPRKPPRRIPPFYAVPVKQRVDGWTPLRQAEFIGWLAQTRSVTGAARRVSMARESAYRLRAHLWSESFCAAWDAALAKDWQPRDIGKAPDAVLGRLPKVTLRELEWRIESGIWWVILRGGKYAGVRQKPDNSAVLAHLARCPVSLAEYREQAASR